MNHTDRFYEYQIRVKDQLDERWFEGLEISQTSTGDTLIKGVFDQAGLHGLLTRIRDLGLELIVVQRGTQESGNFT